MGLEGTSRDCGCRGVSNTCRGIRGMVEDRVGIEESRDLLVVGRMESSERWNSEGSGLGDLELLRGVIGGLSGDDGF